MNDRFGPAALRCCGLAARLLGWRPAEFWSATPAELAAAIAEPGEPTEPLGREALRQMMDRDHDRAD